MNKLIKNWLEFGIDLNFITADIQDVLKYVKSVKALILMHKLLKKNTFDSFLCLNTFTYSISSQ